MGIEDLASGVGSWLSGEGPESDIVVSSRVRLARNLPEFPFLLRASDRDKSEIVRKVRSAVAQTRLSSDLDRYIDVSNSPELDRRFLVERHLISKEVGSGHGERGVAFSSGETRSLMINEEDHIRIQVIRPGLSLEDALEQAVSIDSTLEEKLEWAFSPQFGYLTACPTNVGTGLRASVMVHLPALVFMKQVEKVFQAVSKINLAVRGFYGEGTQATGDFYQISNQVTLGLDEAAAIADLRRVVTRIAAYERKSRELWMSEDPVLLEDRVFRALGMLQNARRIASEETLDHLSAVRMGAALGLVEGVAVLKINEMFMRSLPAHLQKMKGEELAEGERDEARAQFIRAMLSERS